MYGEGISKVGETIDLGVELEIIKKSGSWFSYDGNKIGQGRDAVKNLLLDNPELAAEVEKKIRDRVKQGADLPEEPLTPAEMKEAVENFTED